MHNIKFNEWQEMALKKDIEAILKKINSHEPVFFSLCWEIVIALGAIIVDHLFDTETTDVWIWIICVIIAVLPPVIVLGMKIIKWAKTVRQVQAGKYSVRSYIDTFDNQICYWVMMSGSYGCLLSNSINAEECERIFLYQEGSYYNNKSIQALYAMKPIIDKVFSDDTNTVIGHSHVALYRLQNIIEMIKQHQVTLDQLVEDIKCNPLISEQQRINSTIQENIIHLIIDINSVYGTRWNWLEMGKKKSLL